jgi:hypothetical protein
MKTLRPVLYLMFAALATAPALAMPHPVATHPHTITAHDHTPHAHVFTISEHRGR